MFVCFSYAPWCPACRNLRPAWEKFAIRAEGMNVRVAEVDVTEHSGSNFIVISTLCLEFLYNRNLL